MKATQELNQLGQSIWLDNITRDLLTSGTLRRYIAELSLTGLTSNPTIFDHAIKNSSAYDSAIRSKLKEGKSGETLFFELAIEDLAQAAGLFRPIWDRTNGVDGWVSLEVSPLLAHDTASTIAAAKELHARAKRPNLFIKIPGTVEGLPAIEESIFAGVPVNVTLLFSREHYLAAAEAYLRGIERRIAAGLNRRSSSAAGMRPSRTKCPRPCATSSASQSRNEHTRPPASCSARHARGAFTTRVGGHSACYGRAREPRIQRRPTSCTSRHWPRRSRSTPCRKAL
jgi:transaldolase